MKKHNNDKCQCCGTKENVSFYKFREKHLCKKCVNYLKEERFYNAGQILY